MWWGHFWICPPSLPSSRPHLCPLRILTRSVWLTHLNRSLINFRTLPQKKQRQSRFSGWKRDEQVLPSVGLKATCCPCGSLAILLAFFFSSISCASNLSVKALVIKFLLSYSPQLKWHLLWLTFTVCKDSYIYLFFLYYILFFQWKHALWL